MQDSHTHTQREKDREREIERERQRQIEREESIDSKRERGREKVEIVKESEEGIGLICPKSLVKFRAEELNEVFLNWRFCYVVSLLLFWGVGGGGEGVRV